MRFSLNMCIEILYVIIYVCKHFGRLWDVVRKITVVIKGNGLEKIVKIK